MYLKKMLGWEEATIDEYKKCYLMYGGNFSTNPDALSIIHANYKCKERFFVHRNKSNNILNGAVCVWDNKVIANDISKIKICDDLGFPVASDELILPFSKELKTILPFKSKIISELNYKNITNLTFGFLNASRRIALAKSIDEFSSKTINTRKRQLKKLIDNGFEVRDQSEFTAEELVLIYTTLFKVRRGCDIKNIGGMIEFIKTLRNSIFGKVIFLNGEPSAFQLIVKNESIDFISFDFINIAVNLAYDKFSLGTCLMWINLKNAQELCKQQGKVMRYSFGRPTASYKNIWCKTSTVGRSILL